MKAVITLLIGACFFVLALNVYSEGGTCPPGYYPHNTPGVMGCAAIPGYSNSVRTEPDRPEWVTKWGAIAIDDTNSSVGTSKAMNSKVQAEEDAIFRCQLNGSSRCRVSIAYYNGCAVIAWGDASYGTASASDNQMAENIAVQECRKRTSNCKVFYADCSLPERAR